MTTAAGDDFEPITDRVHDTSWSANLEGPEHEDDRDLVLAQAVDAVANTVPGNHVNLVTHGAHGHPETYLYDALAAAEREELSADLEWEWVARCGCGGHVTRVYVE